MDDAEVYLNGLTPDELKTECIRLNKKLNKAIEYLKIYANDDDFANLNGLGCYSKPFKVINKWIKILKN